MKQDADLFAKSSANLLFQSSEGIDREALEKEVSAAKQLMSVSSRKYGRSSERKRSGKKFSVQASTIENSANKAESIDVLDRKFEQS